ncbi:amino acid adenylation domain-containing protein [Archangium primigenium]|uniref:amino acid adenylation domain-containing protein n=1 Tax=[Archangium] primigenium TaxID=2792470 RepID=UPI001959A94A|nr:amino acid adenylation domain-containing protein [Archangium primigenium]MBM7117218.1 amino acid adenylation domain-containing protein [Archangium primigenium]
MNTEILAKAYSSDVLKPAEARPADVCVSGPEVKQRLVQSFNETTHAFPKDKSLPALLWEQVGLRPQATAVVYGEERLSYEALAERAAELSAYLRWLGVAPDECVGLFVEPSLDLMVGAWGILLSGAAYLPLSPEYPEERLRYMIEDSRSRILFCQDTLKAKLAELAPRDTRIVTLEEAAAFARAQPRAPSLETDIHPRPGNLAYIIYTSGSTGKPKGVMIEHRSIVNQMHWLKTVHGLNESTVVLQKTPMSFDAAQWEILALACGARVVMGGPGVYRDPERLIQTIARHGVTTLQCVPTLLQALVDTETFPECRSLTQIFSGGEALTRNLAVQCLQTMPGCALVNLYGPTECTINSSAFTVERSTVKTGPGTISIGAPVHNTQYYILDAERMPVALGEIGELYVGGVQLARGYLHRPELTAERFIDNPFFTEFRSARLYRTGDLAFWNADGTVQFAGRTDKQVKLRGFRVELDEIRVAIENHDWVKNAAVTVRNDPRTGFQNLIAFIELNPKEAALMDQGNHGAHHQSKSNKLQVKTQLMNLGCREAAELSGKPVVDLPGQTPTEEQRRRVFARKTYRFFEGGDVTKADVLRLLGRQVTGTHARRLEDLDFATFGEILRYFGQYLSGERLLPKYGYASPGALSATQMYFELHQVGTLTSGYYYYHPVHHQLVLIRETEGSSTPRITLHFVGKKRAIQPVYKNNIQEVLEIETGHMVGLFEEILPAYGLNIQPLAFAPATQASLECAEEDYYLGTFEIGPYTAPRPDDTLELLVQAHPGRIADLPAGQYLYKNGTLERISDELVLKKHVIALNQQVYERASLGISVVSKPREDWMGYIELGRKLQHLQMNDAQMGFMSSGYSSKTGNALPSARRLEGILKARGLESGPSYFFVGGRVSEEQRLSEGMKEDLVHMKGPAEMIKDDLIHFLPDYMLPNRVIVLNQMPLTANGKIDFKALEVADVGFIDRPFVAPRTRTEERLGALWMKEMKRDAVSVQDDFFELGGNSLIAVGLVNKINREFQLTLPLQVLFESPTIEKLALKVDGQNTEPTSRLVKLRAQGAGRPIYCWPGLGGFTMNLRVLASKLGGDQSFFGVQAHGINPGETPYATIQEMAAEDIKAIKRQQPTGPYTLWGYSFGARVAFETAYQLEQAGEQVEHLFLIAPGSPKARAADTSDLAREPRYDNKTFVTILFSVFAGSITDPALEECLRVATDDDTFAAFIHARSPNLDLELVKRITRIVRQTYEFKYAFRELAERRLNAPITLFKASGDDYSFIENSSGYSAREPTVIDLAADHYTLLKESDIGELLRAIRFTLRPHAAAA